MKRTCQISPKTSIIPKMARLLSNSQIQSLTRNLTRPKFSPPLLLTLRHRSNSNRSGDDGEPPHPQLIEIDLDSSSSAGSDGGIRKLEEVIHSVIVRRSAPDWLPFLPGYSYWVPPLPQQPFVKVGSGGLHSHIHRAAGDFDAHRIVEVVSKFKTHFGSSGSGLLMSEDDNTSVSRLRGWPSSTFFTGGGSATAFPSPVQVVEVEVKLEENTDYDSKSEDEEG